MTDRESIDRSSLTGQELNHMLIDAGLLVLAGYLFLTHEGTAATALLVLVVVVVMVDIIKFWRRRVNARH